MNSYADICPNLKGQYHCMLSDGTYSLLVIDQSKISAPNEAIREQYSFDYTDISGEPDVWVASEAGENDSLGWLNRCVQNRIKSISPNQNMMVELYLNKAGSFVYAENETEVLICPRKH